jgi:hypothetical protein
MITISLPKLDAAKLEYERVIPGDCTTWMAPEPAAGCPGQTDFPWHNGIVKTLTIFVRIKGHHWTNIQSGG